MIKRLNKSQKELLSDFFNNLAVAWFVAMFIDTKGDLLTQTIYAASMIAALGFALMLRKEV